MEALLLISTRGGSKDIVVRRLLEHLDIVMAYPVFGAYDVVAVANAADIVGLQRTLKQKIAEIELVTALIADAAESEKERSEQPWLFRKY